MPVYRIHRLKEHLRSSFRYAPHASGKASVKMRDYEDAGTVESESPYAAFFAQRAAQAPLEVGDVLETPSGGLSIFKFVGFEDAEWAAQPVKPETALQPVETPTPV